MVIPVHDRNPLRRRPVVTYALIAVNVVVFALSPIAAATFGGGGVANACAQDSYVQEYGAIPKELTSNDQLPPRRVVVDTGRQRFPCPVERHELPPYVTVLTAMFVHGGWAHLLGNLLYLLVFGNNVEDRLGRLRFLAFYLVGGFVAAYGFALADASSTTALVGASGAIAAVLGAYIVMFPRARVWSLVPFLFFIPLPIPAWLVLGSWFLIQYFFANGAGLAGGQVAYLAHVIGFLFGVGVALTGLGRPRRGWEPRPLRQR